MKQSTKNKINKFKKLLEIIIDYKKPTLLKIVYFKNKITLQELYMILSDIKYIKKEEVLEFNNIYNILNTYYNLIKKKSTKNKSKYF